MLVTLIIIISLLAGAAVVVSMQLGGTRSTDLAKTGMTATYCAEAGLAAAAPIVAQNYPLWNASLCTLRPTTGLTPATTCGLGAGTAAEPAWLSAAITPAGHDLDGDGQPDFYVYLVDNDDELAPTANNPAIDQDLRIFIVSHCIKFPDAPKEVEELVQYSGGGTCYQSQLGGCGGNNNGN
jgi:hypothetical protein